MIRTSILSVTALFICLPVITCQGKVRQIAQKPTPAKQAETKPAPAKIGKEQVKRAKGELLALLRKQGITVNEKKGQLWAEGKVNVRSDFIEFVAIGPRGKKHEGLIMLKCKGSTLNTALALLKLKPGKNVDYKPVVPLPTQEEVEKGAATVIVIPPKGPRVYMAMRWRDKDSKEHVVAIEDLLIDIRSDAPVKKAEWIYFGGRMVPLYKGEPPVFIADYEQNYVSNYYAKPDNQLITILHERGNYDDNWWPNEHLMPKRGTPVELGISTQPIVKRLPLEKSFPAPKKGEKKGKDN